MIYQTAEFVLYGLASVAVIVIIRLVFSGLVDTARAALAVFRRFW